ncbi:MAG: ribokinase [Bryobacterales bacterium]|nr:ribokinase [Bryobacterales bacterium]
MRSTILVAGSLNLDFVAGVCRLPEPGQTVTGTSFEMIPGGKGANQACAAGTMARRKAPAEPGDAVRVEMAGCVGRDEAGEMLLRSLAGAGVAAEAVGRVDGVATGAAMINVDASGQNTIVVIPGANARFAPSDVDSLRGRLRECAWLLLQLETPLGTVEALLRAARQEGARTMLDPAPAQPLARGLLSMVDILTPNETEACLLLERAPRRVGLEDAPDLARSLRALGPRAVVLKLGDAGCFYSGPEGEQSAPAFAVRAVDATAAGDTFNAGLAVALSEGLPVAGALRFANASAAVSVTRKGAQTSAPERDDVERLLSTGRI